MVRRRERGWLTQDVIDTPVAAPVPTPAAEATPAPGFTPETPSSKPERAKIEDIDHYSSFDSLPVPRSPGELIMQYESFDTLSDDELRDKYPFIEATMPGADLDKLRADCRTLDPQGLLPPEARLSMVAFVSNDIELQDALAKRNKLQKELDDVEAERARKVSEGKEPGGAGRGGELRADLSRLEEVRRRRYKEFTKELELQLAEARINEEGGSTYYEAMMRFGLDLFDPAHRSRSLLERDPDAIGALNSQTKQIRDTSVLRRIEEMGLEDSRKALDFAATYVEVDHAAFAGAYEGEPTPDSGTKMQNYLPAIELYAELSQFQASGSFDTDKFKDIATRLHGAMDALPPGEDRTIVMEGKYREAVNVFRDRIDRINEVIRSGNTVAVTLQQEHIMRQEAAEVNARTKKVGELEHTSPDRYKVLRLLEAVQGRNDSLEDAADALDVLLMGGGPIDRAELEALKNDLKEALGGGD